MVGIPRGATFLGKLRQILFQQDRPWHVIGSSPFLGGIQVLVQIAHDYFHIRIILYHPVIGLYAVRRIPAARTAPACTEIQNEMLGIQFPVPLFKFAVFKHVSLSLHLLRHRAGRHGRPFCNRLADNFLVFLQPCAIFIGKLFQRHRNGLFSRRHQFDCLHIQGYWTGFHRTACIFISPGAEGRIIRYSGRIRPTERGPHHECGCQ